MNVQLDREDLIALVKGKEPSYELINWAITKGLGCYVGGMADRWSPNYGFESRYTDAQL